MWRSIEPILTALDADPARFEGVTTLGVDEHVWHHVSTAKRGPKELTGEPPRVQWRVRCASSTGVGEGVVSA